MEEAPVHEVVAQVEGQSVTLTWTTQYHPDVDIYKISQSDLEMKLRCLQNKK